MTKAELIDAPVEDNHAEMRVVERSGLTLFGTEDPELVVKKATVTSKALVAVLEQQQLYSLISGKKYPRVEAWTLLGSMLGVYPVLEWTRRFEDGASGGWEARVVARTMAGVPVGAAESMCLRSEERWKDADDHALRSMAQTRATSKALGMPLRFVMTLAGFEGTPAEEMPSRAYERPVSSTTARVLELRCPAEGCTGHLVEHKTKGGKKPGSPYLVCSTGKNGCGLKPIWDTTLADYAKGEQDFGNTTDDGTPLGYILANWREVDSRTLREAFETGGLLATLGREGDKWVVVPKNIEKAPLDKLTAVKSHLEIVIQEAFS